MLIQNLTDLKMIINQILKKSSLNYFRSSIIIINYYYRNIIKFNIKLVIRKNFF